MGEYFDELTQVRSILDRYDAIKSSRVNRSMAEDFLKS
jgi:hypothetical protein